MEEIQWGRKEERLHISVNYIKIESCLSDSMTPQFTSHTDYRKETLARTAPHNASTWLFWFPFSLKFQSFITSDSQRAGSSGPGLLHTLSYCLQNGGWRKDRKCGGGRLIYLKKSVQVLKSRCRNCSTLSQYKKL